MKLTKQMIEDEPRIVARVLGKLVIEGKYKNLSEVKQDVIDNMDKLVFGLCLNCTAITIATRNTKMAQCIPCGHESIYSFDEIVALYETNKHKLPEEITNAMELQ